MDALNDTGKNVIVVNRTVDERDLGFCMELNDDPLKFFLAYPTESVRRKCLEALNRGGVVRLSYPVGLVKAIVNGLIAVHDPIWGNMLECFVSKTTNDTASDIMEFAIQIASGDGLNNYIVKMVVARLLGRSSDEIYWRTPSMEGFIQRLLEQPLIVSRQTKARKHRDDYGYADWDWTQLERGLKIITTFRDTSFMPLLNEILAGMESGEIKPHGSMHALRAADDLHFLKSRTSWLSKVAKDETPDLSSALEPFIRQGAKIKGNVETRLCYQEVVTENTKAPILVVFQASRLVEQAKLNEWIQGENIIIWFTADGFAKTHDIGKFYTHPKEVNWMVELQPTLGKNRVTIGFGDGSRIISQSTAYISCVKKTPVESPNTMV